MDFFKSVFSDDPEPESEPDPSPSPSPSTPRSNPESPSSDHTPQSPDSETLIHGSSSPSSPSSSYAMGAAGWSFGGIIRTFTTKSESVLETYRRDLQEFGSGLKKETEVIREVASRAVKDLPTSLEISASKAQGSLESVGQAIDSIGSVVWKSTAEIIAQGKDSLLAADLDSDFSDVSNSNLNNNNNAQAMSSGRYSRFDAQLRAIQCDVNTYVEEPEDVDDYGKWKSGFNLEEQSEEIEGLMRENGTMDGIYKRVVPNTVDHEGFWCRYYYRVHRLKQAEFVRANLVKRAISTQDEEELSWDVDDDEDDDQEEVKESNVSSKGNDIEKEVVGSENSARQIEKTSSSVEESGIVGSSSADNNKSEVTRDVEGEEKCDVVDSSSKKASNEIVHSEENSEANEDESLKKVADAKAAPFEGKAEPSESGKDSDISVVSSQPSPDEEDLGWDEIEDIGSGDERKVTQIDSPDRAELRKRLSAAEEDEDLSWDIEDDDEPIKS